MLYKVTHLGSVLVIGRSIAHERAERMERGGPHSSVRRGDGQLHQVLVRVVPNARPSSLQISQEFFHFFENTNNNFIKLSRVSQTLHYTSKI